MFEEIRQELAATNPQGLLFHQRTVITSHFPKTPTTLVNRKYRLDFGPNIRGGIVSLCVSRVLSHKEITYLSNLHYSSGLYNRLVPSIVEFLSVVASCLHLTISIQDVATGRHRRR